jgi:putative PIN family toxin of toxin-antitoxin system
VKVFLDTNVLVSAFMARGLCADLFRYLLAEHQIMTGEVNLIELREVLTTRFPVSEQQLGAIESLLRDQIVVPRPETSSAISIRDPDDGWVLASAVAGKADLLATGDRDLLTVAAAAPIPIVSPREAWERLRRIEPAP